MSDLLTPAEETSGAESMTGVIDRFVFQNDDGSFCVARFTPEGRRDPITLVGPMAGLTEGETVEIKGSWESHSQHGRQFAVKSCMPILPSTLEGLEKYLGSGMIKGIGPKFAKRIVKHFGLATLDVLDREPERLTETPGVGAKRCDDIQRAWREHQEVRQVMVFLLGQGVSPRFAARLFKFYGSRAIQIVRERPYQLAEDIWGMGFQGADRIARNQGFPEDSPERARAGVVHALNGLAKSGHTCAPRSALREEAVKLLNVGDEVVEAAIDALVESKQALLTQPPGTPGPMVHLRQLFLYERSIAARIRRLAAAPGGYPKIDATAEIDRFESSHQFELAEQQRAAVAQALEGGVTIITGGPGTGKTTIVRAILRILEGHGVRYELASPTGRAAKRLAETTRRRAATLHRLLKWSPRDGKFVYNRSNPLRADLLIVDEASMVDVALAARALDALRDGTALTLVGDIDQLPSVGPGNVLRDLIESGVAPVIRLTEVFRQARRSLIVRNAHRINHGEMPHIPSPDETPTPDFFFVEKDEPAEVLRVIKTLVQDRIPFKFGFRPAEDVQVITPMRRGEIGAENLNREMQELLNPSGRGIERGGQTLRVGDKVMQIRNNYDKDVYNGDIGLVLSIDREEQELKVRVDERVVSYGFDELDELIPAYAITVHKSQGSEYRAVVMPIHTQHYIMLQRNLIYTALTRARELACFVGTRRALAIAARNDRIAQRWTGLTALLTGDAPMDFDDDERL